MEKIRVTQNDIEKIQNAFIHQKIEEPEMGEFFYFNEGEAKAYIESYLRANSNSGYVYALEGREAYIIIRRENEYLKFMDILRMIFNSYRILGIRKLNRLQKLERDCVLSLEEKYAIRKKRFLFVGMVMVCEEFQGQGYFRNIMEEIFELAKKENRVVILNTDTIEKKCKYEHLGFILKQTRVLEENNVRYDLEWM